MFLHSECVKDGAEAWPGTQLIRKVSITKVSSLKVQARSPKSAFPSVFYKSTDGTGMVPSTHEMLGI